MLAHAAEAAGCIAADMTHLASLYQRRIKYKEIQGTGSAGKSSAWNKQSADRKAARPTERPLK
jgi:hypothetical protein